MPLSRLPRGIEAPPPKSIRRVVDPLIDPVTLAEAKLFARIDDSTDDAIVTSFITGATRWAEDFTRRAFITQEWKITFDALPFDFFSIPDIPRTIELPRPELQTLESVEIILESGSEISPPFAITNFIVDLNSQPGRITLKPGQSWPSGLQIIDAVRIQYKVGYGLLAADVPESIKTAIKRVVATWYLCREDIVPGTSVVEVPNDAKMLLQPYRIMQL